MSGPHSPGRAGPRSRSRTAPQPHPNRMVPFGGHPLVVGVVPGQPELVALTAVSLSRALGPVPLYFAYVDVTRRVEEEFPDGTVRHGDLDPDLADDSWQDRQTRIERFLDTVMADTGVDWQFRYLAGRPDRALTHLARAIDAAGYVIGTRAPGAEARVREWVEGSVAASLSHHQHRPVIVVPLSVVDWAVPAPWA